MTKTNHLSSRLWLASLTLVLPLLSWTTQAQNPLTNGLVAYWNFDAKDFKDSIGTFDGTENGSSPIAFVAGKTNFGQALQLDGVDQYVEISGRDATYEPDQLAFAGGSVSIAGWFKVEAFDKDWQALVAKGEGNSWRVARNGSGQTMSYAGGLGDATGTKVVTDGNWHHFVAMSDAAGTAFGTALYIDGKLDGTVGGSAALAANASNVMIGNNPGSTGRSWNGLIDDLAIWNRVLTASEIEALYGGGTNDPLSGLLKASAGTVTITQQPANVTVLEGTQADFSVQTSFTGKIPPVYQWQKNGTDITNATASSYKTPVVLRADTGAKYTVKATVPGATITSAPATLTVTPDTAPPTIALVEGLATFNGVTVHFNKPIDNASAVVLGNYAIDGGLTLSAPVLKTPQDVVLTTTTQTPGTKYTLTINNVKDVYGNTIVANTKASFFPATLATGLVAYWTFDTNLTDSVNGFHGTARGTNPVVFVDGKFGKALKLDGTDQFVEITGGNSADNLAFPGGSISVAGWFKVDAFDTSWQALVAKGEGNNWRVARNGTNPSMAYAGGLTDAAGTTDVSDGNWHHFVAITDADAVAFGTGLFIDGVLDASQSATPALIKNAKNVMIGENPDAAGRQWNGEIDDLAIWNRVLTEADIAALYDTGAGKALGSIVGPNLGTGIKMTVTRSGQSLTIQWSPTGGTLETSPTLGPTAVWTAVGTANPATVTIGAANAFYRIRQ